MTTLFINAVSSRAGGGLNDLVHTLPPLMSRLEAEGWQVKTWVSPPGAEALAASGFQHPDVTTVRGTSPAARGLWEFKTLPGLVRRGRPSVVFHFSNFIFRSLPVPQMTVLRSPTFFSRAYAVGRRRGLYQSLRFYLGCRYSVATIRRAATVFCISETHRRDIIDTIGPLGEKVQVSHLGFSPATESEAVAAGERRAVLEMLPPEYRETLAPLADSRRNIIVNVAHYYEHKNLGDLLEAIDLLKEELPEVGLILTSGITSYRGPRDSRTDHDTRLAKELAGQGVLFDLGPVTKSCVWPLLALADAFVFPSSLESFGHPLLEAMSMRVPVVAADTPIHREIAGHSALFHRVGDPRDIALQVKRVLQGQWDRQEMLDSGLRRTRDFSWDRHVDDLYRAIVEAASRTA